LTQLTYSGITTESGTFFGTSSNLALSDARKWSDAMSTNLQLNWARSRASSGGPDISRREALEVRLNSVYNAPLFTLEFDYQRNIPIGSTLNFVGGLDRTPQLTLRSDSSKLFGERFPSWMPKITLLAAAGNYRDNFNLVNVNRYFVDLRASKQGDSNGRFALNYDLAFKQGVYSGDAAQYTPMANIHLRYRSGKAVSANLRYNYSRQHGFTPIQFDRTGQYNLLGFDVLAQVAPGLSAGGQVGFDLVRYQRGEIGWISPSLRLEYKPSEKLRFRGLANYMPQSESWGNIRMDFAYKVGASFFGIAARYDGLQHKWGNVNLFIDALKWGRLKVSTLLLYNGYLNRFDSRHLALTYDLHCAEAVLQILETNVGFRPGREVVFFIRIKALPFDSPFGIGRQGQPLDIGTGGGW
jgi:hypothetical protein